jgi:FdhD protein
VVELLKPVDVLRVRSGGVLAEADRAAVEEPLEVRLHGAPYAVIMRTPGADRELAAGFLLAERVIRSPDELGTIEHCEDGGHDPTGASAKAPNVVNVTLAGDRAAALEQLLAERRKVVTSSSCGLCGRLTIESLRTDAAPLVDDSRIDAAAVSALPDRLRAVQAVFDQTGGLHAAGLFTAAGALEQAAEDVGRHNAVDKVVGRMVMADALPLSGRVLFVSGRASFEIVQKAVLAGIPVVGAVSAPSTLAIDLARAFGVTLLGFVRDGSFNVYAHSRRIEQ